MENSTPSQSHETPAHNSTQDQQLPDQTQQQDQPPPKQQQHPQDHLPPPSQPSNPPPQQPSSRKRKVEHAELFQNSNFFKIRAIVKDLRPYFVEVLHAADFRECNAAHEIRAQMQVMMELYKQLRAEMINTEKPKKNQEAQETVNLEKPKKLQEAETANIEKLQQQQQESQEGMKIESLKKQQELKEAADVEKPKEQEAKEGVDVGTPEKQQEAVVQGGQRREQESAGEEKREAAEAKVQEERGGVGGSYVVGGSPVGWNFMTSSGGTPTYYGVTKESRAGAARIGSEPSSGGP